MITLLIVAFILAWILGVGWLINTRKKYPYQ